MTDFQETAQQNTLYAHPGRVSFACIPDKIYFVPLEALDLSVRLYNIFWRAGISTVGEILEMEKAALERLKLGERSIQEVARQMQALGLLDSANNQGQIETQQEETTTTAPDADTAISLNRRPTQNRFVYEVAVSQIPSRYRERLPHQSRICWLSEPTPMRDDPDTYTVRIAETPAALAQIKTRQVIHLNIHNEKQSQRTDHISASCSRRYTMSADAYRIKNSCGSLSVPARRLCQYMSSTNYHHAGT